MENELAGQELEDPAPQSSSEACVSAGQAQKNGKQQRVLLLLTYDRIVTAIEEQLRFNEEQTAEAKEILTKACAYSNASDVVGYV